MFGLRFCGATFAFSFYFYFYWEAREDVVYQWVPYIVHRTHNLFDQQNKRWTVLSSGSMHYLWDPKTSFLNKTFIKNGFHDTIHTFKNYFVTVFSVFRKISSIQTNVQLSNDCLDSLFNGSRALFTGPTSTLFIKKDIKNRFHSTIHIFKNYFVTVFSVFSKINGIQTDVEI